jgi:hypothetical protein
MKRLAIVGLFSGRCRDTQELSRCDLMKRLAIVGVTVVAAATRKYSAGVT